MRCLRCAHPASCPPVPLLAGLPPGPEGARILARLLGAEKGLAAEDPGDCSGAEEGGVSEDGGAAEKGARKTRPVLSLLK